MLDHSFSSPRQARSPSTETRLRAICGWNDGPMPLDIHVHPGFEVGLVLAGEEQVHLAESVWSCGVGDVWLCGMWEPHGWRVPRPGTRTIVLIFPPEFIGEEIVGHVPWLTLFTLPPDDRARANSPKVRGRVLEIGEIMRREIEAREPFWERMVRLELLRLLTELARGWGGASEMKGHDHKRLKGLARLMPAFGLVHSVPWRRVPVREAAAACGMSISRFHTVFGETMNMSFGRFSLRARLSFAARQLITTDRPIAAIAAEAGFVDDSHLHHCFAKQYGRTPSEYRRGVLSELERATEDGVALQGRESQGGIGQ